MPEPTEGRPSDPMRPTQVVDAVVERMEAAEAKTPHSRMIEDGLAIAGIIQALFYGTLEGLRSAGFTIGTCVTEHSFPWVTVIIFLGCVLPKTVGRASAGKAWELAAGLIGRKAA